MRILLSLLLILPTLSRAQTNNELRPTLERLNVVFKSARTPHTRLWPSVIYAAGSSVALSMLLHKYYPTEARRIFWFVLAGNLGWGAADRIFEQVVDSKVARRPRDVRDYMRGEELPDFFRLDLEQQMLIARANPDFEAFLFRIDQDLREAQNHPGSLRNSPSRSVR